MHEFIIRLALIVCVAHPSSPTPNMTSRHTLKEGKREAFLHGISHTKTFDRSSIMIIERKKTYK
jgi:hypothetical protein